MIGIDTNTLIYAFNPEAKQHEYCKSILEQMRGGTQQFAISTQVLGEFARTMQKSNIKPRHTREIIRELTRMNAVTLLHYSEKTILRCIGKANFWDSLLAETYLESGVQNIITFDKEFERLGMNIINE